MNDGVARQRCVRHPDREAAARCPVCGRFFCRECVTEHAGRILCASCLARAEAEGDAHAHRRSLRTFFAFFGKAAAMAFCFLVLWGAFFAAGRLLSVVPHRFHDGTAFGDLWEHVAR